MQQAEMEKNIENNIMHLLFEADGRPFSLRQLQKALAEKGCKYDLRSIEAAVKKLQLEGKVKTTNLARAIAVYIPWNLPLVEGLTSLDELVKKGQFPLYEIVAKMKDIGFPEEAISPEFGSAPIGGRTRDLMESAEKEIMWWAGDFSRFEELKPSILKALEKRDLKFRILMRVDLFSLNNARMILDLQKKYSNLEVRHWESKWRGAIFDRKRARLIEKLPRRPDLHVSTGKPGTDQDFRYKAYNIDGQKPNLRPWLNWLCMVWESQWKTAEMNPKVSTLVRTLSELSETPVS